MADDIRTDADALAAFVAGASLTAVSTARGCPPGTMRSRMIRLAGGDAKWRVLMAGRTGPATPFGPRLERPPVDDTAVPRITSGKGWRTERTMSRTVEVFISPKEELYCRAADHEPATLIVVSRTPGLPPLRLRRWDRARADAKAAARERKADRLLEARRTARQIASARRTPRQEVA